MRLATNEDLKEFANKFYLDRDIYPYLQTSKTNFGATSSEDDWNKLSLVDNTVNCLLRISIDRTRDNDFSIGLWSKSPLLAGRAVAVVKELIVRYRPRSINSVVHASNLKSIKLHNKIFGAPWGIEPGSAWNMATGQYEDLLNYRKLL